MHIIGYYLELQLALHFRFLEFLPRHNIFDCRFVDLDHLSEPAHTTAE